MTNAGFFWLGTFVLNVLWLLLLPTGSGKAVAALGAAVAVFILARRVEFRNESHHRQELQLPVLGLFLLPALSFVFSPRIIFWRLDGRGWLVLVWLACATILECGRSRRPLDAVVALRRRVPPGIALFLLWTAVLWFTVVLDLGLGQFIAQVNRSIPGNCHGDSLATFFSIWEQSRPSQHLFLAWRSLSDFAAGTAYENHVHPYLFTMYAWMSVVKTVFGRPWFVASNTTPILAMLAVLGAATILSARAGTFRTCRGPIGLLTLFVAVGLLVTMWRFWDDLYRFNSDNAHPLVAAVYIVVYAMLLRPVRTRLSVLTAMIVVALGPIHLPMLLLAVGCLFARPGVDLLDTLRKNRNLVRLAGWSTLTGVVVIALPRALIAWKGYGSQGSTLLLRSGLDGSTAYFTNMIQAFWSACPRNCCGTPRPVVNLLFPAFVPLAVFLWPARNSREVRRLGGWGRVLLFLAVPYVMSLIFFTQSVSIHPYLYDQLLLVPVVVVGVVAMTSSSVRSALNGPRLLAFLLFSSAVIMSNLIAIAQGLTTLP